MRIVLWTLVLAACTTVDGDGEPIDPAVSDPETVTLTETVTLVEYVAPADPVTVAYVGQWLHEDGTTEDCVSSYVDNSGTSYVTITAIEPLCCPEGVGAVTVDPANGALEAVCVTSARAVAYVSSVVVDDSVVGCSPPHNGLTPDEAEAMCCPEGWTLGGMRGASPGGSAMAPRLVCLDYTG